MRSNSFLKIGTGHLVLFSLLATSNAFSQHPKQEVVASNIASNTRYIDTRNSFQNVFTDRWFAGSFTTTNTDREVVGWIVTELDVDTTQEWNHGWVQDSRSHYDNYAPVSERRNPPFAIFDTRGVSVDGVANSDGPGEPVIVFGNDYRFHTNNRRREHHQGFESFPEENTNARLDLNTRYWIVLRAFGDHNYHPSWYYQSPLILGGVSGQPEVDYQTLVSGTWDMHFGILFSKGGVAGSDTSNTVNSEIEWVYNTRVSGSVNHRTEEDILVYRIYAAPILVGDLNEDLDRNAIDYNLMLSHIAGFRLLPDRLHPNADMNFDGIIDSTDANLLNFVILGITPGDLNDDERVNLFDLVLINDHISGTNALPDELKTPADIEFDFMIDDKDRSLLIDLILER